MGKGGESRTVFAKRKVHCIELIWFILRRRGSSRPTCMRNELLGERELLSCRESGGDCGILGKTESLPFLALDFNNF